jgi:hypothetical protein
MLESILSSAPVPLSARGGIGPDGSQGFTGPHGSIVALSDAAGGWDLATVQCKIVHVRTLAELFRDQLGFCSPARSSVDETRAKAPCIVSEVRSSEPDCNLAFGDACKVR